MKNYRLEFELYDAFYIESSQLYSAVLNADLLPV